MHSLYDNDLFIWFQSLYICKKYFKTERADLSVGTYDIDHIGTPIIPRLAIGAALCDVPATGLPSIPSHSWHSGSKLWMLKVLLRIRPDTGSNVSIFCSSLHHRLITDHSAPVVPQASVVPSVVTPSGASCKRPTVGKPKTGCKCWGCNEI